jgi:hypothetical protein
MQIQPFDRLLTMTMTELETRRNGIHNHTKGIFFGITVSGFGKVDIALP